MSAPSTAASRRRTATAAAAAALWLAAAPPLAAQEVPTPASGRSARGGAAAPAAEGAGPAAVAAPSDAGVFRGRVERQGVTLEIEVEPVAGGPIRAGAPLAVRLAARDVHTGEPFASLYPAAWFDRLPAGRGGEAAGECSEKVATFLGGSLLSRPAADLNVYHVVALNEDPSLTVVDPLFGFGGTRLLALVELRAPGEDWALGVDAERLFVSIPEHDEVAVVETATWDLLTHAEVGPRPGRVALQPDGRHLWVAYREPLPGAEVSGVSIVDTVAMKAVRHLATGRGEHDLAVSDDDRWVFVTNRDDGTLTVIDAAAQAVTATVATGDRPVSVAWSPLARRAYVAHAGDGSIAVVDPGAGEVDARLAADPGLAQIRFAPGGRFGLAVNPESDLLHVIDAARGRIVQRGRLERGPDQVAFSDELAYVRHRGSETLLMIPLTELGREGAPIPVADSPAGRHPPGAGVESTPAAGIVQAPGAAAVLVANPLDEAIYYYKEGMAAPMGHFQNYGRRPRAVLVVDRSLRETAEGVYETVVQVDEPGDYDLALYVEAPRVVHCFGIEVAADPILEAARARRRGAIAALERVGRTPVGGELTLRFRVTDPASGAPVDGLADVGVLGFLTPGIWQQRQWARPLGGGLYEVTLTPPRPGIYWVFVQCPSLDLEYGDTPALAFEAVAAGEGVAALR